jgi:Cellulase (glycosyl hydrolase family 5)
VKARLRRGALLGALALACTPRCSRCQGAAVEEPPPPPDTREYGDTVIAGDQWTVMVDEGGQLRVRFNNTDVITSSFKLGGAAGASFDPVLGPTVRDGDAVRFAIDAAELGLHIDGRARPQPGGAEIAYTMTTAKPLAEVSGGGIELAIRNEARILGKRAADPVALPGGNGFSWDTGRGVVRFEFDSALPLLQATSTGGMQCALYYQRLEQGERSFELRITLPDDGAWALAPFTRYPVPDASWHANTLPWNDTPIDLSFLNDDDRPAGVHGPVRIDGEQLLRGDGVPLKLWGTNVVSYALFSPGDAEIAAQAKRIAAFGFNLVRLHHHDSAWVEPNVFGRRASGTRKLDPAALERIDRWVAALEAEGIYVWIDLHVGRVYTPSDGIEAYAELEHGKPQGFNYVNASIAAAGKEFARAYLDRENPYTHRRYLDDPAVVGVLVTNENDLTMHYGNLMLERSGRPVHHGWLEARTRAFAERTGLEVASPVEPWRLGNTKLAMGDIEATFYRDAIDDLRALGYRGAVATSSLWGDQSLFSLPSLTVGDIIDTHSYGGPETLSSNAHVDPHFVHLVATAAVPGLPLSITEWNIPAPTRDRFVGPTLVAGIAALQGWAAPMLFAYTSNPLEAPQRPEIWSSWDDPAVMAMMPAAALMFRRDVAPAREHFAVQIDRDILIGRNANAFTLATVRTLTERSQVRVVLPKLPGLEWMRGTDVPEGAQVITEPDDDRLDPSAHAVESDTGELRRDWELGVHTVNTARSVAATGWLGGQSIELGDVRFELTTPKAAIALSSLDGLPLAESKRILAAAVAQVAATDGNRRPYLSEPVRGAMLLRSRHASLVLEPLGARAKEAGTARSNAQDGVHRLVLEGPPVHFWLITPAPE